MKEPTSRDHVVTIKNLRRIRLARMGEHVISAYFTYTSIRPVRLSIAGECSKWPLKHMQLERQTGGTRYIDDDDGGGGDDDGDDLFTHVGPSEE
ncbi:uncharacterized protein LOC105836754 isoform X2 [Monomorium pharaonis]|uniref:uncharacterized protein LOC105836754 isoform X2 n=1 Tax=Monomorium pharaonis TaxID=307658 RepID=UPI00063F705B|nr:uncharacterized protein LOC105836754 isoform X2 [Monomorium pharaonis]